MLETFILHLPEKKKGKKFPTKKEIAQIGASGVSNRCTNCQYNSILPSKFLLGFRLGHTGWRMTSFSFMVYSNLHPDPKV